MPVSRKSRELFGPEKPFVKLRPAYSVKLVFSYVVKGIIIKINAKFRASRGLRFEDTKRIISPEMCPKRFGTFGKRAPVHVPRFYTTTFGKHSLTYLGPKLWNILPTKITNLSPLPLFKGQIRLINSRPRCNANVRTVSCVTLNPCFTVSVLINFSIGCFVILGIRFLKCPQLVEASARYHRYCLKSRIL